MMARNQKLGDQVDGALVENFDEYSNDDYPCGRFIDPSHLSVNGEESVNETQVPGQRIDRGSVIGPGPTIIPGPNIVPGPGTVSGHGTTPALGIGQGQDNIPGTPSGPNAIQPNVQRNDAAPTPVVPDSVYKSLNSYIANYVQDDDERQWLIGLQTGIGLGIVSTREAVLNEIQFGGTVFCERLQKDLSNAAEAEALRMKIGRACQKGFDLRVAYRAANLFKAHCHKVASDLIDSGSLSASDLPLMGNSLSLSEDMVARCRKHSEWFADMDNMQGEQPKPNVGSSNNPATPEQSKVAASFLGDGENIGGVDMTQLDGTAAIMANALKTTNGSGHAYPEVPLRLGIAASQGHGFAAAEGSGLPAVQGLGYEAVQVPGYGAAQGSGFAAAQGPGYRAIRRPGFSAGKGPGLFEAHGFIRPEAARGLDLAARDRFRAIGQPQFPVQNKVTHNWTLESPSKENQRISFG
ncbi:hypothetical protein F4861DRAFT_444437 [Xylaria intraflava]|nr:hypothetical protein F4861DRAFT_444437 [Xylaria intraflava]